MEKNSFYVIGLMSGTSLDGLDMVYAYFIEKDDNWQFEIFNSETVKYNDCLKAKLKTAHQKTGKELLRLHNDYGTWIGNQIKKFIAKNKIKNVDFIASHGHTVFHEPQKRFNFQVGNPYFILKETKIPVVADFRSRNIVFGGQGAPLVPIGDRLLFGEYTYRINLGGFANISFENDHGETIAYDICPVNIVINSLVEPLGIEMDKDGELAAKGSINPDLLTKLESIEYYSEKPPKSLAREWVEEVFNKVLLQFDGMSVNDMLATIYEHIAIRVAAAVKTEGKVLFTGGGTKNKYLMKKISEKIGQENVVVPSNKIIDYKESLIFAFLGVLSYCKTNNCLSSYTGAPEDMVCGVWYY